MEALHVMWSQTLHFSSTSSRNHFIASSDLASLLLLKASASVLFHFQNTPATYSSFHQSFMLPMTTPILFLLVVSRKQTHSRTLSNVSTPASKSPPLTATLIKFHLNNMANLTTSASSFIAQTNYLLRLHPMMFIISPVDLLPNIGPSPVKTLLLHSSPCFFTFTGATNLLNVFSSWLTTE